MNSPTPHPSPSATESKGGLRSLSFQGLLFTQFLGATNDNILRWLVIGVGKQYVPQQHWGLILGAGTACFVAPYLVLAAPAGYLADRFNKRSVIVACKIAEVGIMAMAIFAIWLGSLWLLFVIVAMMGAQSALFGPSKLGSIPEMLRADRISAANGLVGLTTVSATVIGMAVGSWLTEATRPLGQSSLWLSAAVLIGVAAAGWFVSLGIDKLPVAAPDRRFPRNFVVQTWRDLRHLAHNPALLRVALGIMFFWSLGALAQMNIDQFAFEGGATKETEKVPLLCALVFGVGLGSVLAGYWSGGHVELGILPLGAGGVAVSAILLFTVQGTLIDPGADWTASYVVACMFLALLGISAGLFDVPLAAYMQHRSPVDTRGVMLAASNFLTFAGIMASAGLYTLLRSDWGDAGKPLFDASQIFLLCGVFTIPVFVYIVWRIPQATIRFLVWMATHTIYRVRVVHRERLPATGGALLVPNHVSWMDGVLLLATSSRPIRMMIYADFVQNRLGRWLAKTMGAIPIRPAPKSVRRAIETAREAIDQGELVCIFPEGAITRSGQLQGFKRGMMEILRDKRVPVVPVYLDELWGSIFSFRGGMFFWKTPQRLPYPVSIWFGQPIDDPGDVHQVRQAVQDLGAEAVRNRKDRAMILPRRFMRMCRKRRFSSKIADSAGTDLTGASLLMRTLILRRLLRRHVLAEDEQYVGILLPPSAGGVVTNTALTLDGRVTANLNYTVSSAVMNDCIQQAGIRHVLTSRRVMEKLDLTMRAEVVYLEDLREKLTLWDKLVAAFQAHLLPIGLLERRLGLHKLDRSAPMTVIFTSGSTGRPKGVQLTHQNILSNAEAIDQVVHLSRDDVIVGILPFFHSFGFTVTLWTVMGLDIKGVYHFTPLDAKQVGKLCQQHRGTVLLATPTFLRTYLRRCSPEEFATLDVVVVGAEKMPIELADQFEAKFGARPVEGYGATELSPLVSVNAPPSRSRSPELDLKEGSVGRAVPGVSAKVIDPDTGEELGIGNTGMLLITGPNVMQGYLGNEEKTAEVLKDGWYVTGDMAEIDADGFITITGRLSRFSKIGGEMVPHIRIEEELTKALGEVGDELPLAVTAVPDAKKGERLIVLHTEIALSPEQLCAALAAAELPNLWIPSTESFYQVDAIPVLGSGKLDLHEMKQLAAEKVGSAQTS